MELQNPNNGQTLKTISTSNSSTPIVSSPSSSTENPSYFSAPSSPTRFLSQTSPDILDPASSFEFHGVDLPISSMHFADEIFLNGQIRPLVESQHPLRSGSVHRRARSMSPIRTPEIIKDLESATTLPNSSSGNPSRNSNRWIFLKDLLYRSKSEGSRTSKEMENFWKSKRMLGKYSINSTSSAVRPLKKMEENKQKASVHERLYNANRAHSKEMRKRTLLPYRQGLFWFSGFGRLVNPVSSR